jgi:protein phosphatase
VSSFPLTDRHIVLAVAGRTDRGRRRAENQDDFLVVGLGPDHDQLMLRPENQGDSASASNLPVGAKGALLMVADGMGGGAAGGLASRLATLWVHQELSSMWAKERTGTHERFALFLRDAVERANMRIHQQSQDNQDFRGMGTTATVAGVLNGFLYFAQVGDSRAYLIRNGGATQITRDQSFVQALIDAGTMTEEEAEQSDRSSVILQALGPKPVVEVDLTYHEIRKGDVLVLCSDGLFRLVRREEIADIILKSDPATACATLVDLANERGGHDNITVVVARLDGDGLDVADAHDHVERRVLHLPDR